MSMPPQSQAELPGSEATMDPAPESAMTRLSRCSEKLTGKVALVTGGDSGIGRAVAVAFAKEGADVAISYLDEHEDAQETMRLVQAEGRSVMAIAGDLGDSAHCDDLIQQVIEKFEKLDILVNNAAEQHLEPDFENDHRRPDREDVSGRTSLASSS